MTGPLHGESCDTSKTSVEAEHLTGCLRRSRSRFLG
jgi:hypothetical protein